jgi:hypothetical protein
MSVKLRIIMSEESGVKKRKKADRVGEASNVFRRWEVGIYTAKLSHILIERG